MTVGRQPVFVDRELQLQYTMRAENQEDILDLKADAAEAYKDAAIEAAQMLSDANLMTELTHSVGEGSELPETNVTWSEQSSL